MLRSPGNQRPSAQADQKGWNPAPQILTLLASAEGSKKKQKPDDCAANIPLHKDSTLAASSKEKFSERLLERAPTSRGIEGFMRVEDSIVGSEQQPRSLRREGRAEATALPASAATQNRAWYSSRSSATR